MAVNNHDIFLSLTKIFKQLSRYFLADLHIHATISLEEVTKNNVKYFKTKNVDVNVETKDIHVDVGKLFGGDEIAG